MEIKELVNNCGIIGVIGNYQNKINYVGKVRDINIKNITNALKMVLLDENILDKNIDELSISEYFKVELMTKLDSDLIIIGNLANSLIYKDKEYMKKLFIKLNKDYHKKIIIIDNDLTSFMNCVKDICVVKDNKVIYESNDYYDDNLYKYVKMPKIVEFIKYVNKNKKNCDKTIDIYELIKDIFRRLS